MKIRELQQQLDEGFLDNFVNKVKAMAGGDGPTGIVRALMGNNAALNKFADALVNAARPQILNRLGNGINAIQDGATPMPIGMIYKTTMAMLPKVVANEKTIQVEPAAVKQILKNNKAELLRLVLNGKVAEDEEVRQTYNDILSGAVNSRGNNVDATTKTVALIIAAAVMFLETSQQDAEADGVEIDKDLVAEFNEIGIRVTQFLASKDSKLIRDLKANDLYKDRVEELIVNIAREARSKYLNAEPAALDAVISSPPQIVSLQTIKNFIGRHAEDLDTDVVNAYAEQVGRMLQRLFVIWATIAKSEPTPGRPQSFELMRHWAADFLQNHLDQLDLTAQATPDATAPVPAEAEEEIENLEASHDAGEKAVRDALAANKSLTPDEIKNIYNQARAAWGKA